MDRRPGLCPPLRWRAPWKPRDKGHEIRNPYLFYQHQLTVMDRHALAILEAAESWDWLLTYCIQASGDQVSKFKAVMPKLLSGFIAESQALRGLQQRPRIDQVRSLLDQFWVVVGQCHPQLEENSASRSPPAWTFSSNIPSQLKSFSILSFPPLVILRPSYSKGSIERRSTSLQYFRWPRKFLPISALLVGPDTNLPRN